MKELVRADRQYHSLGHRGDYLVLIEPPAGEKEIHAQAAELQGCSCIVKICEVKVPSGKEREHHDQRKNHQVGQQPEQPPSVRMQRKYDVFGKITLSAQS